MEGTVFVMVSKLFLQYDSDDDVLFLPKEKSLNDYKCLLHWNIGFDQVRNENTQQGQNRFVPVIKKTHITKLFLSFLYYNNGDTELHKIKWHLIYYEMHA